MAKKTLTIAQEALIEYTSVSSYEHAMFHFINVLKGRVCGLSWFKNKKGVAESVHISFGDKTAIKVTTFTKLDGSLRTSIKITT